MPPAHPSRRMAAPPPEAHSAGAPQEPLRDLVSQLKRDRILSAAIELFYSQGFARTTLDQVARALGMTKPFIYQFFSSKNEILAEICSHAIKDAHEALSRTLSQQGGAGEKLRAIVRAFILSVLNNQANAVIYSREETELAPKDRERIAALRRDFDRRLVSLLEEGIAAGEFAMDDVRLTALAIGSMVGWSPVWFRAGGRLSKEAAADGVAELVIKMVGAPPR